MLRWRLSTLPQTPTSLEQWLNLLQEDRYRECGMALPSRDDGLHHIFFRGGVNEHSALFVSEKMKT